jgi:NADP-dependent aldehyde dehydrogenase
MDLHGKNLIAGKASGTGATFRAENPVSGEELPPDFSEAAEAEIDEALKAADNSFSEYRDLAFARRAEFLEVIAQEITNLGPALISRAQAETALPEARLTGERGRTINQVLMFARLVREGSWVDARIDRAQPDRKPLAKPDLRRMLRPIGPVAVFGASNFPLAFSVAGGDTISALAAGNPVVVKAHPAHPGTSELAAQAILAAAQKTGMPRGVFSLVHGRTAEMALNLVRHPLTKAVGFTGSLKGGRALFDAAAARPEPIPVFAEMGSTNPVFLLPGALSREAMKLAEGLVQSVTLGVGQFCTNPGLVFGVQDPELEKFIASLGKLVSATAPGTMLYSGICERFGEGFKRVQSVAGVRLAGTSASRPEQGQAAAAVFATDARTFLQNDVLQEEMFGPSTIVVACNSAEHLEQIARQLPGQLTATVHGTEQDLVNHRTLLSILEQKAGRLIFNGFPTGVEVCASMHHSGPYPATTWPYFTSVGTAAIHRFARPVCFQNFPDAALPLELRKKNTRNIWRLIDDQWTQADVA